MSEINLRKFIPEALREIRANRHEQSPAGVLFPRAGIFIGGFFGHRYAAPMLDAGTGEVLRDARGEVRTHDFGPLAIEPNRVVNEGLARILNLLAGQATGAQLYLAPWGANVQPAANWTGATWAGSGVANEFTAYTPTTRVPWNTDAAASQQLSNEANLAAATITFNAGGPYTIRGCSLVEASAKSATTGALIAASRFGADLTGLMGGGKLALQYDLQAMDEADAP